MLIFNLLISHDYDGANILNKIKVVDSYNF